ncbi:hypothetical protein LEM8419_03118 [Neolewinella maritima]|uniref:Type II toxin-antitoxin system HicA family toxin n=1 Tax=Neolewinella maritima TaxID=1383882 RepID=A0ABN8FE37_9BACT|nr:hypothetical protein [Neolewinella maritima]CAH1002201.1 hypothetical protein LEM8419_03118 [Neolewinella maritima]
MLPTTKHSLKKLETLLKELGYTVRYEKGHFASGYCLVEQRKIVIINRFYDTEGRINVLYDMLSQYRAATDSLPDLSPPSAKLLRRLARFVGLPAGGEEE